MESFLQLETSALATNNNPLINLVRDMVTNLKKSAAQLSNNPNADKIDPSIVVCKCKLYIWVWVPIEILIFSAVKEAGFNPALEYAGDEASLHSDFGKDKGQKEASESSSEALQVQPVWTAQLRASLTQIYEKCSINIPAPLQRSSHLRPLLASTSDILGEAKPSAEVGPQSSESSDLSNSVA